MDVTNHFSSSLISWVLNKTRTSVATFYSSTTCRILLYISMTLICGLITFIAIEIYSIVGAVDQIPFSFQGMYAWGTALNFGMSHWAMEELFIRASGLWGEIKNRDIQKTIFIWFSGFILFFILERTVVFYLSGYLEPEIIMDHSADVWSRPSHIQSFIFCFPFWCLISFISLFVLLKIQTLIVRSQRSPRQVNQKERPDNSSQTDSKIYLKQGADIIPIMKRRISHVSVEDHYVRVFTTKIEKENQTFVKMSLKQIKKMLPETEFIQVHRSHIVNKDHIQKLVKEKRGHKVYLIGYETPLPVSRQRLAFVKDNLIKGSC